MNKTQRKLFRQLYPLILGIMASLFSVFIFLSEYKSFVRLDTLLGVFGALAGIVLAYTFARIKDATDAPKIFISYAHKDKEFVLKLYEELRRLPFDILWDQHELQVGDNIKKKTDELLSSSDYLLFVSSKNSTESQWATIELKKAQNMKKKILPVVIDESMPPDIIKQILYADFTSSFEDGMSKLVRALKATRHNKSHNKSGANNAPPS